MYIQYKSFARDPVGWRGSGRWPPSCNGSCGTSWVTALKHCLGCLHPVLLRTHTQDTSPEKQNLLSIDLSSIAPHPVL